MTNVSRPYDFSLRTGRMSVFEMQCGGHILVMIISTYVVVRQMSLSFGLQFAPVINGSSLMCNCRWHVQFFFCMCFSLCMSFWYGSFWELLSFGIVSFEVIGLLLFLCIADFFVCLDGSVDKPLRDAFQVYHFILS